MKAIVPPYTRYFVSAPHARKTEYVCRPVVPVRVSFGTKAITFDALLDSGADECTFPGWVAKTLGKNVHTGAEKIF